jgi:hypothetical protein
MGVVKSIAVKHFQHILCYTESIGPRERISLTPLKKMSQMGPCASCLDLFAQASPVSRGLGGNRAQSPLQRMAFRLPLANLRGPPLTRVFGNDPPRLFPP